MKTLAMLTDRCATPPPSTRLRGWRTVALLMLGLLGALGEVNAQAPSASSTATCLPEAQPPTAAQVESGWQQARDRGFLWRIEKDGRTSYLYGTLHIARMEWMFPGRTVMEAIRTSDVVALEVDMSRPDVMEALQAGAAARPGEKLSPTLASRIAAHLRRACQPEGLLHALSPEMLVLHLAAQSVRSDGLESIYSIDSAIGGLGHGLHKTVVSLESAELQLQVFRSLAADNLEADLGKALTDMENGKLQKMMRRMARIWADSRFDEMLRHDDWCDCMRTAAERAQMKRLNDDRNPGLANGIDALHTSGQSVFAAVGSLHMVGPKGLPSLLAQRGYRVQRIDFKQR